MGYKIKLLRDEKGMTQEELSKKSGVSRATIVALENNGKHNATTSTLLKLANGLDTTIDSLFFGDGV